MDIYNIIIILVFFMFYFRVIKFEISIVIKIGIVFWMVFLFVVEICVLVDENRNDFKDMVIIK